MRLIIAAGVVTMMMSVSEAPGQDGRPERRWPPEITRGPDAKPAVEAMPQGCAKRRDGIERGDETEWLNGAHAKDMLDNLHADKLVEPMISTTSPNASSGDGGMRIAWGGVGRRGIGGYGHCGR